MIYQDYKTPLPGVPLDKRFVHEAEHIKRYLSKVKELLDLFDKSNPSASERREVVDSKKKKIFKVLNKHFLKTWEIAEGLNQTELFYHKSYYQKALIPLLATQPLNKRIYEKPLGYPGDYVMMNYYYDNAYEGKTTYDMLLHRYTLELPISRAHINRKPYFKERIREIAGRSEKNMMVQITDFGCGPAREIIELIREEPDLARRCVFNCADIEPLALEYVKKSLDSSKTAAKVKCSKMDVLSLIKKHKHNLLSADQDLVYAAGLFDYFKDKVAKSVLEALYSMVSNSGVLIIVNVCKQHDWRAYMELLGDWYLNLRDEEDLLNLARDINGVKEKLVEKDRETGKNLYLVIKK